MRFSNVSSQGEQCMMILIILVMFISDRASDMKNTGTGRSSSGGDEGM